jgi:hypothetical protein
MQTADYATVLEAHPQRVLVGTALFRTGPRRSPHTRALRLLRRDLAEAQRLERRLMVVAELGHPALVGAHTVAREGERLVVERRWVDGAPLEGPMEAEEAVARVLELLDALSALHGRGLSYGDLRLDRVRIDRGGRLVLLDAGLHEPTSVAHDLQRTVALLDALCPRLPRGLRDVVRRGCQGAYDDARALAHALGDAQQTPVWPRRLGMAAVGLLFVGAMSAAAWPTPVDPQPASTQTMSADAGTEKLSTPSP